MDANLEEGWNQRTFQVYQNPFSIVATQGHTFYCKNWDIKACQILENLTIYNLLGSSSKGYYCPKRNSMVRWTAHFVILFIPNHPFLRGQSVWVDSFFNKDLERSEPNHGWYNYVERHVHFFVGRLQTVSFAGLLGGFLILLEISWNWEIFFTYDVCLCCMYLQDAPACMKVPEVLWRTLALTHLPTLSLEFCVICTKHSATETDCMPYVNSMNNMYNMLQSHIIHWNTRIHLPL